jgi:mono/diheme cytochrome c family protein
MKTAFLFLAFLSCRQRFSSQPPIHINPNMDVQPKLKAQGESSWFPDGRASRPAIQGTVAKDENLEEEGFLLGSVDGVYLEEIPIQVSMRNLKKGKMLYNSTCASCHGHAGLGDGLVFESGMFPPVNLHLESVVRFPVGYIYQVISEGVRDRMPKMIYQLPDPKDRWRVVAYVRALQMSQRFARADVPAEILREKGW